MLSALIPVYNFDVTQFITELHKQLEASGKAFEIILLDDASQKKFIEQNKKLEQLSYVSYVQAEENIGRSRIRNRLASLAKYDSFLFMDCDSRIDNPDFASKYLEYAGKNVIAYGGRTYNSEAPDDKDLYLRWLYGVKREVIPVEKRKRHPYHSFMTNNFLIPRSMFMETKFNESLKGYGHEDTLFGYELRNKKYTIVHIDNPLCHIGLEPAEEFLNKTREGIRNLAFLVRLKLIPAESKLLSFFSLTYKLGISKAVYRLYKKRESEILDNLKSSKPSLFWFDMFKLGTLIEEMKDQEK